MRWIRRDVEGSGSSEGSGERPNGMGRLSVGPVWLDLGRRRASVDAWTVVLPSNEALLLSILMRSPGRVIAYSELAQRLGISEAASGRRDRRVRRLSRRLRRRLSVHPLVPPLIEEVAPVGVRFTFVEPSRRGLWDDFD